MIISPTIVITRAVAICKHSNHLYFYSARLSIARHDHYSIRPSLGLTIFRGRAWCALEQTSPGPDPTLQAEDGVSSRTLVGFMPWPKA